jgi:hypothetical protein
MSLAAGATVFFDRDGTLIRDVDDLCRVGTAGYRATAYSSPAVANIWLAARWIITHANSATKQDDQS